MVHSYYKCSATEDSTNNKAHSNTTTETETPEKKGIDIMFTRLQQAKAMLAREEGQGLSEYAIVMLFVIIPVVGSVTLYGSYVNQMYSTILTAFH